MAYRLERDESLVSGIKRIVRDEMESAGAQLSGEKKKNRDKAIHEARKSIKKVRALVRLLRAEPGDVYSRENTRLRDIARRLSEFRDAFVSIETFDDLKGKFKDESRNRFQSVRTGLTKRRNEAAKVEDVQVVIGEAATAMRKAAKRVKTWPLQTDGYSAIGSGLEKTYRRGRKALAVVREDPSALNFHELRKRVKDHWYHIRLLENLWTDMMAVYEKSLKDLETWLGTDHNLCVLRDKIVAEPVFYGNEKDINQVLDLIDKYQKELRDSSLALADRIYEEKPGEFRKRMKHLWDTWRNEPKRVDEPPTAA
jgi:CHAD domain-containing protein